LPFNERKVFVPLKSKGSQVRRSTRPLTPPSILSADGFLYTSTPAISSGGTSLQLSSRPGQPAENISRPFRLEAPQVRPRTAMPPPSTEKCSGSPRLRLRFMVTPTTRCSTSVIDLSGSLPASSATTESTISSAFCLIFWADCSAARWPVTVTGPRSVVPPESCACTAPAPSSTTWSTAPEIAVRLNCLIACLSLWL